MDKGGFAMKRNTVCHHHIMKGGVSVLVGLLVLLSTVFALVTTEQVITTGMLCEGQHAG
jgi:uncharacterized membrane protein HdeD (DUF308 family)